FHAHFGAATSNIALMHRYLCLLLAGITITACAADTGESAPLAAAAATVAPGCIASGGGALQARLRGAFTADLDWTNELMQCEGGARPDGKGLRVTLAGPLPVTTGDAPARQLRFIFGIDYADQAAGSAQALPTN